MANQQDGDFGFVPFELLSSQIIPGTPKTPDQPGLLDVVLTDALNLGNAENGDQLCREPIWVQPAITESLRLPEAGETLSANGGVAPLPQTPIGVGRATLPTGPLGPPIGAPWRRKEAVCAPCRGSTN